MLLITPAPVIPEISLVTIPSLKLAITELSNADAVIFSLVPSNCPRNEAFERGMYYPSSKAAGGVKVVVYLARPLVYLQS